MPNYLGQHFLQNKTVVEKIIATIDPQKGDSIIEIGPGRGALTIPLAKTAEDVGAKIIAVEKDPRLAEALPKTIEVIHDDALVFLKSNRLHSTTRPTQATKLVGNIPYYITGHLLRIISELEIKPERCVFMVQKEVAERIIAAPPKMNRLAASVQYWADPKIITHVHKGDFSPAPKIDSAVILLKTRPEAPKTIEGYYKAVHSLFAQPRKTIINNLFDGQSDDQKQLSKEKITELLEKININPALRPQNLTIADIDRIASAFF